MLKSNKLIIFLISLPFLMLIVFYSLNGHPGYSDDSNFIRNHVAALIGGNLFGLVGMIFFIPIFAVIYRFVKEWVEKHEQAASVVAVGGIIDEEN